MGQQVGVVRLSHRLKINPWASQMYLEEKTKATGKMVTQTVCCKHLRNTLQPKFLVQLWHFVCSCLHSWEIISEITGVLKFGFTSKLNGSWSGQTNGLFTISMIIWLPAFVALLDPILVTNTLVTMLS